MEVDSSGKIYCDNDAHTHTQIKYESQEDIKGANSCKIKLLMF